ncbi:MAG: glycosyltransferase family 4 protein [Caldilineaceae bacterium]
MRVGIAIEETWSFLHEIADELKAHHAVSLFERRMLSLPVFNTRLNRMRFRRDMRRFMQTNDVLFFEWASELLIEASRLPKTCGIVTRLHRYEMYKWVDQVNWRAVDKIILVSQAKKREFGQRFPEHVDKVVVVTEAVDPHKFQPLEKPFGGNIGILCHLTPRKRVYELILAFSELVTERPELRLHIGGGEHPWHGDYYFALRDVVRQLKLEERVIFYGKVAEPEKWYGNIDIFISNAYSEGLQVSPLEAMAAGCICFAHHWAGADEMLPVDYLYFTDRQLQDLILRYCDLTESQRRQQRHELRQRVCQDFNVHKTKVQIREIVESV